MIGTPVAHDCVYITEGPIACSIRHKPGGWPGGVGPFVENCVHLIRQVNRVALGDL